VNAEFAFAAAIADLLEDQCGAKQLLYLSGLSRRIREDFLLHAFTIYYPRASSE
jgi:hypothetical protein